jgi:hypothetical protein
MIRPIFVLIHSKACPTAVIRKNEKNSFMRKRNFILLLLPIIGILWTVGWSLYWNGNHELATENAKTETGQVSVHVASEVLQEQEIQA